MKIGIVLTAAAALVLSAAGVWALGLEDGFASARAAVAAAPKAPVCWTRADDREADEIGLPTSLCFAAGQKGFTAQPKTVFANSFRGTGCDEFISGAVEISASAAGGLRIVAKIESTNDYCHSSPSPRVLEYTRR